MPFEDTIDGLGGGNRPLKQGAIGVLLEVIMNRLWAGDAAQAIGRGITNGKNLLFDQRRGASRGGFVGAGVAEQDLRERRSRRQFLPKPLEPFFHPTQRGPHCSRQLTVRPIGVLLPEMI